MKIRLVEDFRVKLDKQLSQDFRDALAVDGVDIDSEYFKGIKRAAQALLQHASEQLSAEEDSYMVDDINQLLTRLNKAGDTYTGDDWDWEELIDAIWDLFDKHNIQVR